MHMPAYCTVTVFELRIRIGQPFIESRNISLDSPLEMYSKCVLAYQFWLANPEIGWRVANGQLLFQAVQ